MNKKLIFFCLISFSGPVSATLTQVDIGDFGVNDAGTINIGGNQTAIDSGTDTVIPAHTELVGNTLTIAFTAGNPADTTGLGFSVDSLTFHVKAVPEPSLNGCANSCLGSTLKLA